MGGKSKKTTVGYKIYLGLHFILCRGPIDAIKRIRVDEKNIAEGTYTENRVTIDKENLFGGKKLEGGISGDLDLEFGSTSQTKNDYLTSKISPNIPAYRGVVGVVLRQMYLGTQRYIKKWDFRAQRVYTRQNGIEQWYPEKAGIPYGDEVNVRVSSEEDNWQYQIVSNTTPPDVETFPVPSSGWSNGQMPFGRQPVAGLEYDPNTSWPHQTGLWVRKRGFGGGKLTLTGKIENACYVYFDGEYIDGVNITNTDVKGFPEINIEVPQGLNSSGYLEIYCTDEPADLGGTDATYLIVTVDEATAILDMNPAHIIRECIADPDWGMGYPDDIDDDSFTEAADTLHNESFGLSLVWDRQKPISEFIANILEHIDAALYVSRSTGNFVLKLIRDDYAESDLITLDEDSVEKVDDFSRVSFGDLVNSVSVVYYNREISKQDSATVQDIGLYQQQGVSIETTRQYPGISNKKIAARVAERDLKALSTQLMSCTVYADRTGAPLNIGDAFILDWPDYGISSVVMRCLEIAYGDGRTNKIKITCSEDVYATPVSPALGDAPESSESLAEDALPATPRLVIEAPYYALVRSQGESQTNDALENNNYAGYLIASGGRPTSSHINSELWVDDGSGIYEDEDTLDFSPWATPSPESGSYILDKTTTLILLEEGADLDQLVMPTHCQMGDEIMRVDALDENSDGRWEMTVGRGCMDTTPQNHTIDSSGKYIYFYEELYGFSSKEFSEGETATAKILSASFEDLLTLSEAPSDSVLFRKRAILPYPPGQLKINGEYYPDSVVADSGDNVLVEWAHRDRLQQTSATIYDHTEGDIGPEAGTTYNVLLYDHNDAVVSEQSGISGTSSGVDLSDLITNSARIDVLSVRDGVNSWMPASHRFEWNFVDSGLSDSNSSFVDSSFNDTYFASVVSLVHFDDDVLTAEVGPNFTDTTFGLTHNTATPLYGAGSASGGSSQAMKSLSNSDWSIGSSEFTIELTNKPASLSNDNGLFFIGTAGQDATRLQLVIKDDGEIQAFANVSNSTAAYARSSTGVISAGTEYDILVQGTSTDLEIYVDGVLVATDTRTGAFLSGTPDLYVGYARTSLMDRYLTGNIDEWRFTAGVARAGGSYTPDLPFPNG